MNPNVIEPMGGWPMGRRGFVKGAALAGAAALAEARATAAESASLGATAASQRLPIPQKPLGRTGIQVSALSVGGFHLGTAKDQQEASAIVTTALEAGINFFDNAWEYHHGESEVRLGQALKGKRDQVVLMTKVCTHGRKKDVAMRMLEDSLRRLQTDYLDIWQIHEVVYFNDPDSQPSHRCIGLERRA